MSFFTPEMTLKTFQDVSFKKMSLVTSLLFLLNLLT